MSETSSKYLLYAVYAAIGAFVLYFVYDKNFGPPKTTSRMSLCVEDTLKQRYGNAAYYELNVPKDVHSDVFNQCLKRLGGLKEAYKPADKRVVEERRTEELADLLDEMLGGCMYAKLMKRNGGRPVQNTNEVPDEIIDKVHAECVDFLTSDSSEF